MNFFSIGCVQKLHDLFTKKAKKIIFNFRLILFMHKMNKKQQTKDVFVWLCIFYRALIDRKIVEGLISYFYKLFI